MKATMSGVKIGLVLAVLFSVVAFGALYRHFLRPGERRESAGELAGRAERALEDVRRRDLKATLRPARYDSVLAPLDEMLRLARRIGDAESYDPVADYPRIAAYCEPVMRIALEAHRQARRETSFLRRNFRFMRQRGDACQYLAAGLWNRLDALSRRSPGSRFAEGGFQPSPADSEALFAVIDAGLEADSENKQLWYMRGTLNRANGVFAGAERDLRKALDLDADYAAAWNVLGLVMINLREFKRAEEAFAAAAEKSSRGAEAAGVPPGPEHTAALFNLARLHEGLLSHYSRLEPTDPDPENKREMSRHREGMESALRALIAATADGTPERGEAQKMLSGANQAGF
ncbi:MAG: hypothetical protein LBU64_05830 [Planctomycetota bacterium]|jgi:tetratricopeptide (TPR) repeat protein|nr:hypothetical protein [Planctomycetota bacterium]